MFEDTGAASRLAAVLVPPPRVPLPTGLAHAGEDPRLELARLRAELPAPDHAARLVALGQALPDATSQLTLLTCWDRYASWVAAQQQAVLAAVAGPEPEPNPDGSSTDDWVRADVGCALRLSPGGAHRRIELACRLACVLRGARDALGRGELTFLHALTLSEQVRNLSDPAAAAVGERVLPRAAGQSLSQFRAAVVRAVATVDPTGLEAAPLRTVRDRRVERWRNHAGAAVVAATGPAVDTELIYAALTASARAARDVARSDARGAAPYAAGRDRMDVLRYDTLLGWARAALAAQGQVTRAPPASPPASPEASAPCSPPASPPRSPGAPAATAEPAPTSTSTS